MARKSKTVLSGILRVAAGCSALFLLTACGGGSAGGGDARFETGGIYSTERPDGTYGVVKLLLEEEGTVHIRFYVNRFDERPQTIEPEDLQMQGGPSGVDIGIEHIPMPVKGFRKWRPELISTVEVSERELKAYRAWKETGQ